MLTQQTSAGMTRTVAVTDGRRQTLGRTQGHLTGWGQLVGGTQRQWAQPHGRSSQ